MNLNEIESVVKNITTELGPDALPEQAAASLGGFLRFLYTGTESQAVSLVHRRVDHALPILEVIVVHPDSGSQEDEEEIEKIAEKHLEFLIVKGSGLDSYIHIHKPQIYSPLERIVEITEEHHRDYAYARVLNCFIFDRTLYMPANNVDAD